MTRILPLHSAGVIPINLHSGNQKLSRRHQQNLLNQQSKLLSLILVSVLNGIRMTKYKAFSESGFTYHTKEGNHDAK